tara:strand:+ start:1128 stop:1766 length:639 start_codon:yes stop_codon:yes gene_type:complete
MAKKCPPGIFCIENYTLMFFVFLLLSVLFFMYIKYKNNLNLDNNNSIHNSNNKKEKYNLLENTILTSNNLNGSQRNDVFLNPYSPPLRDNTILNNEYNMNNNINKVPINISTQSFDTNYRQVGILTRINGAETILPLMGRPLFSNRDKWNFYTMNDKNNMIKLPINFKNRSCTNDQGCDNLYDGDTVHVEGYNDIFRVTIYDNNSMKYIPYL